MGIGYAVVVPLTIGVGWTRYENTKLILGLSDASLHEHFGHLGVTIQASLLGAVLVLTVVSYWSLGDYYVFNST